MTQYLFFEIVQFVLSPRHSAASLGSVKASALMFSRILFLELPNEIKTFFAELFALPDRLS